MIKKLKLLIEELDYKIDWKTILSRPGAHKSKIIGSGFDFKTIDSILQHPNARRIDLAATLKNIGEIPMVRIFEQKSKIKIISICDFSASFGFEGKINKMHELANFATSLGYTAYRTGDLFGMIGFSEKIEIEFEPAFSKGLALEIGETIWNYKPKGKNSNGLSFVADYLPRQKSLLFLASDFYFDEKILEKFLKSVSFRHDVVPIIFWDISEFNFPKTGFIELLDPETKKKEIIFLRPGLEKKIKKFITERKSKLLSLFASYGIEPLIFTDGFKPIQFSKYFLERRN